MNDGLNAVYEELKRLRLEGMDRVFINDNTLEQLQPCATQSTTTTSVAPAIDLQTAVNSGRVPSPPSPKAPPGKKSTPIDAPLPEPPIIEIPDGDAALRMQWLKEQIEASPVCQEQLRQNDKLVFGSGSINADIFYCGDAPGEEEADNGIPFQGKAGELLTKILSAMGLKRESVYMTNILKWRPKHNKPYGNRPPTQEEMNYCLPYLKAQIEIVQPKVIIGLGNATVPGLLGSAPERTMSEIRGTWQSLMGTPVIFTFQPSYLLFNDTMKTKRMAWEDMLKAMEKIGLPISEKQQAYFLPKQ